MKTAGFGHHALVLLLALTLSMAVLPVATLGTVQAEEGKDFTLTIIHTNDVHAHYEPFDSSGGSCDADEECWGGSARTAGMIDKIRGEGGNVLLVDAGDQFQGTLFFNQYKGQDARELMNDIGYQVMTLGNHEFDSGPDVLTAFVEQVQFPIVSANLEIAPDMALAPLVKTWVVLEVGGEKVGVFGLITEELASLSSPGPNIKTTNAVEAAKKAIAALEEQGVNKIIALTHIGYLADQDLASKVDGIDVVVGGHSHTLLSNTDAAASGPYPTVVKSPNGQSVLVVTDGAYAKNLGDLQVTFDSAGIVQSWDGGPIPLDDNVAANITIAEVVARLAKPIEELKMTKVGESAVELVGERTVCRFEECSMGDLIADAMIANTVVDGTQIAMMNGGGIRAGIKVGDVSLGDVLQVLPFGNTIATFGLKGEYVLAMLENGVSRAENPDNEGTGRFPQVSGVRFTWDPTQPVGARVSNVEVGNEKDGFKPLDPQAIYKLATNNFNRTGGDDYAMLNDYAIDPYDYGSLLADAVADYIQANSPVDYQVQGRISKK